MAISSELEQLLASWIPRQPWFPKLAADFGSDPDITPMSVARAFTYKAEELGGFVGLVAVISVGDGPTLRRLNIPLALRGTEDIHLRNAFIGSIDDLALGTVYVYDGPADPVFVNLMADAIINRTVFDGGQLSTESLRHGRGKSVDQPSQSGAIAKPIAPAEVAAQFDNLAEVVPPKPSKAALKVDGGDALAIEVRPIEVSDSGQSKSTVIIHDEYEPLELSFFRVLENGMPSSLTIPVLLTEAGSRSVPEVIGWSSGRWYDMFEVTEMEAPMALLSHVDVEAAPAWREAVDIVCSVDSGSIGGYNAQAADMGRRIGELHSDMAAEFGIVEGSGEPTKQLVKKWTDRVDWALGRAPLALESLLPELRKHRAKLLAFDTIGRLQKIHGELTLDHVVSSPTHGYSVVKFTDSTNSDPKPVALDLVALLRSVDYAAGFARLQRTGELDSQESSLVVGGFGNDQAALRAIYDSPEFLWASQVQNSLLSGYSRARGESLGLGDEVLRAALIDRLLVEVVTELRNRPNWLSVPLSTLTLVLKGKPARASDEPTEVELSVPGEPVAESAGVVGSAGSEAVASEDIALEDIASEVVESEQSDSTDAESGEAESYESESSDDEAEPGEAEPNEAESVAESSRDEADAEDEPVAERSTDEEPTEASESTEAPGSEPVADSSSDAPAETGQAEAEPADMVDAVEGVPTDSTGDVADAAESSEAWHEALKNDAAADESTDSSDDADAADSEEVADTDASVDAAEEADDSVDADTGNESGADAGTDSGSADVTEPVGPDPAQRPSAAKRVPEPADSAAGESAYEEEFVEEEEESFISPIPATFAARGAVREDADSTGQVPQELKLGKHGKRGKHSKDD